MKLKVDEVFDRLSLQQWIRGLLSDRATMLAEIERLRAAGKAVADLPDACDDNGEWIGLTIDPHSEDAEKVDRLRALTHDDNATGREVMPMKHRIDSCMCETCVSNRAALAPYK